MDAVRRLVFEALSSEQVTQLADLTGHYAGNKSGWPEQLARFAALPTEAAQHIRP